MTNTRVVLLRSNPVDPDPPVEKVADSLLGQGFSVTVVGWNRDRSGEAEIVELPLQRGTATAVRFCISAVFGGGIKKNLLPLISFQRQLYVWLKKHRNDYDIIHAFDFDTGFVANKIARKFNKKLVYHILDFYVDSHGLPGASVRNIVKKAEIRVINDANCTVICSDKRKEQIAGSDPKKLEVIHNTPKQTVDADVQFGAAPGERCKIVYVGILAGSRFIEEILDFVKEDERFEFHIGGFGTMEEKIQRAASVCDRIVFYGKLPYEKTLALESSCDIMTAIYDPSVPNHRYAAPNKFYESLMLGKPVIMAKNTGFDEIITENNIGCVIEYDRQGLADAFNELYDRKAEWISIGEKMTSMYKSQYSWAEMERRLEGLYAEL